MDIGDRMKGYEHVFRPMLIRRMPVIIRVDGKAFHTFMKQVTPQVDPSEEFGHSEQFHEVMARTAHEMAQRMQNCVFAYTQSDEISFFLKDWTNIETDQWFGGNLSKLISVSASIATAHFNDHWQLLFRDIPKKLAYFDSRAFNLPQHEVANYFIWRQQDATRNSIIYIARKYFSHKELHGKKTNEMQEMLWRHHDINWNDFDTWKKRGTCIVQTVRDDNTYLERDENIPIFTEDRDYIEGLFN